MIAEVLHKADRLQSEADAPFARCPDVELRGLAGGCYYLSIPSRRTCYQCDEEEESSNDVHVGPPADNTPPDYRSGFGAEGVKALYVVLRCWQVPSWRQIWDLTQK
jgi:hypothetical protein